MAPSCTRNVSSQIYRINHPRGKGTLVLAKSGYEESGAVDVRVEPLSVDGARVVGGERVVRAAHSLHLFSCLVDLALVSVEADDYCPVRCELGQVGHFSSGCAVHVDD